jgi:hypothetical protein
LIMRFVEKCLQVFRQLTTSPHFAVPEIPQDNRRQAVLQIPSPGFRCSNAG